MRALSWAYSIFCNKRYNEYVRYIQDECVILTKAWNKLTDKEDGSWECIVEFESTHKNNESPLGVRVDLKNMVQTTSAIDFKAVKSVITIRDDGMSAVADRSAERFA